VFKTIKEQIKYWNNISPSSVGPLSPYDIGHRIRKFLPSGFGRVLDFGCGLGRIYEGAKPFDYYVGVDISHQYLMSFRAKYPNVHLVLIQDFKIPLLPNDFDTIICYSVFTHIQPEHMDLILAQFHRVLKPRGKALVSIFELEIVGVPEVHNWIMIERQKFIDLCSKNHFKVIGETKVPGDAVHQTLFMLENLR